MGPLCCGQGTVPQTTLSDLLSTGVLVTPPGAPVGAGERQQSYDASQHNRSAYIYIPADEVMIDEVTVLLLLPAPNTAVTLTVQLLLGVTAST